MHLKQRGAALRLHVTIAAALIALAACGDRSATPDRTVGPTAPTAASPAQLDLSSTSAQLALAPVGAQSELLACPSMKAAQTSRIIGPGGGLIAVNGNAIAIPRGAVSTPTRFTLTVPGSGFAEVDVRAEGADHYVFSRPVVITIDYSSCGVAPAAKPFYGWYIDQSSHSLLENMAGVDDRYNQRLFFATMHLSGYAVAYVRDEVE
ncbi:MAG: hypothetical protein HOQ11_14650 [Gemmatimonadaceae bacterium]|nr:hypothetical protein [Gemmatimonadaceae bacterium]NUQ91975.1 hypothetical protein [Gemmatimonadaceae bacterium]NUS98640.1 hypothetical protein [Gemmatimonadaceae bacterium]